jgi:hypothetical protein
VSTSGGWITANVPQGPYINNLTGVPAVGQIWYDTGGGGGLKVFDGYGWTSLPSNIDINLSPKADEILRWAESKMKEEAEFKELIKKHPGLKELNDRLEMMKILCKEENVI